MNSSLAGWFWLIALIATAAYYVIVIGRLLLIAIRTGRVQGRGRVYDRTEQPIRYWLLTTAGILIGIILVVLAGFYAVFFVKS